MVIPACSRVALIWSSSSLISSPPSAGALPLLSSPMRPAKYNVLPVRIPPLNGACGLSSGKRMARRPDCAGACGDAPRTVSIPTATSAMSAKPTRRFGKDLKLFSIVPSIRSFVFLGAPRCEPRVYRGNAALQNNSSKRNDAYANEVQRSRSNDDPQQHALQHRPPAHLLYRLPRDSCADQK